MSEHGAGSPPSPNKRASDSSVSLPCDPIRPQPQIPDHELLHPIGRGAYGEVWLARNLVGTLRAVKVVYRQDFGDPQPFDREFKGMRKFEPVSRSHAGLVNVLQIGRNDADGYFYYVMELADAAMLKGSDQCSVISNQSEATPAASAPQNTDHCSLITSYTPHTLRHDLRTRGRLPFEECLQLGLTLTGALQHLHQGGLVHRDIKPSNIIFVNGRPKLADIGLVAGVDEARSFVGTEGYIPPEGPGKPQADLYSLGIVLYVMSTGKRHDAFPEPLAELATDPDHQRWLELNAIIHKACHSDPRKRYQAAGEMLADLELLRQGHSVRRNQRVAANWRRIRTVGVTVAALVLVALGLREWTGRSARPSGPGPSLAAERASVFVLPFRGPNELADKGMGLTGLTGRITDAFIDSLALIEGVKVGPRKSGWVAYNEDDLRRNLATTNDSRHVLTGQTSLSGDTLRLALRLYEAKKDQPIWRQEFSGRTNELTGIETRAIEILATVLDLKITSQERQRIEERLAKNLAAYRHCLEALTESERKTKTGSIDAAKSFELARDLDPNYVDAQLAWSLALRESDRSAREIWPELRNRMRDLLRIDDTPLTARYWIATSKWIYDYDWEGAKAALAPLIREYPTAHLGWAHFYRSLGRFEDAREEQQKVEQADPSNIGVRGHACMSRFVERRHDEAIQVGKKTIEMYPDKTLGYYHVALSSIEKGDYTQALDALQKVRTIDDHPQYLAILGRAYARMGDRGKAMEILRQLEQLSGMRYVENYFLAWVHASLGDKQRALDCLEKAYEERSEFLVNADWGGLRTDPAWDNLQDDPRFQALLKKVGLDVWPR